jgi:hypothetical protein
MKTTTVRCARCNAPLKGEWFTTGCRFTLACLVRATERARAAGQPLPPASRIERLAMAWSRWNSASGKASGVQVERIMGQLSADVLERMLRERGVEVA